jgi:hypothetical protein
MSGVLDSVLAPLVEPLRERAALVAGFAVAKELPEDGEREDSAGKEDQPFSPLRHATVIMAVLRG